MGYLGSHISDYWPTEMLEEIVRQIRIERKNFPEDEEEKILNYVEEIKNLLKNNGTKNK